MTIHKEMDTIKAVAFYNHLLTIRSLARDKYILLDAGERNRVESLIEKVSMLNLNSTLPKGEIRDEIVAIDNLVEKAMERAK